MSLTYTSPVINSLQLIISSVIEQRQISWLCHFTSRKNLENIKKYGLLPRNLLPDNALVTDQIRADRSDAICLSISKPNKWMFEMKQNQGMDLCLILIDPRVLYEKNCVFFPHNAATASYRNVPLSNLQGERALEALFDQQITFQKSGREAQSIWRNSALLNCEPTSDQAEVQCLDVIEPKYILHIFDGKVPLDFNSIKEYMEFDALCEFSDSYSEYVESVLNEREEQSNEIQFQKPLASNDSNKITEERIKALVKAYDELQKINEKSVYKSKTDLERSNVSKQDSKGSKQKDIRSSSSNRDSENCLIILIILGLLWLFVF